MAAEVWKTEYHAIGADGEAFDWLDTLEEAKAAPGVERVEKVVYYHEDRTTVWTKDGNNEEENED